MPTNTPMPIDKANSEPLTQVDGGKMEILLTPNHQARTNKTLRGNHLLKK